MSYVTRSTGTWNGNEFNSFRRRRPSASRNEPDRDDDAEDEGTGTIDRCVFVPAAILFKVNVEISDTTLSLASPHSLSGRTTFRPPLPPTVLPLNLRNCALASLSPSLSHSNQGRTRRERVLGGVLRLVARAALLRLRVPAAAFTVVPSLQSKMHGSWSLYRVAIQSACSI